MTIKKLAQLRQFDAILSHTLWNTLLFFKKLLTLDLTRPT